MHSRASCYITCSCQSRLSITDTLDHAKNLALKLGTLSPPVLLPPLAWPTSLLRCSVFSLASTNSLAVGKSSDSSLHPYQEPKPTGGRRGRGAVSPDSPFPNKPTHQDELHQSPTRRLS